MNSMNIRALLKELTLEEKAALTSGDTWWYTKPIERLSIPRAMMADGPHGLRKREGQGEDAGEPTVCFPAACLTAASFDYELLFEMGVELGRQLIAFGVDFILGPGVNIKRSPLCGRNFEYFSEDPLLAGVLAEGYIKGVQSTGKGTSLKHFFANNQEHRRLDGSSQMDERTMREIYFPAFERAVKNAKPWTVMASYNKINGIFATECARYLIGVLRDEWGFDGVVVSDWGAVHNRPAAVAAGCDLTMPAEQKTDGQIAAAVADGSLSVHDLDTAVENILRLVEKSVASRPDNPGPTRFDEGTALARKIAAESIILLKNEDNILPLATDKKLAFIGEFAKKPRFQGGGSSQLLCERIISATDAAAQLGVSVTYAPGYIGDALLPDEELITQAVKAAKEAEVAVVFAGLPEFLESEEFDRDDMKMPLSHTELIEAVCRANPRTVVVLHNGAPVEMPWADGSHTPLAIIEAYLGGQAVGQAVCDILFGEVNPSGRLPESVPFKLEDNPSYLFYKGEDGITYYNEGVFVGYRYYETKKMAVRYPFGYGLSYTTFEYSNLRVDSDSIKDGGQIKVEVDVTNTGSVKGKEVVLVFTAPERKDIIRPVRELKAFIKLELSPGETKTASFVLNARDFSYWCMKTHIWRLEADTQCNIEIRKNASEGILSVPVKVLG